MKKFILPTLLFSIICNTVIAQRTTDRRALRSELKRVKEMRDSFVVNMDTVGLNKLIEDTSAFKFSRSRNSLILMKARIYKKQLLAQNPNWNNIRQDDPNLVNYINAMSQAIELCPQCAHVTLQSRHDFLKKINAYQDLQQQDKQLIKQISYISVKPMPSIALSYKTAKSNWIGAEFTALNVYTPPHNYRPLHGKVKHQSSTYSFHLLNLSYAVNPSKDAHEVFFTLFKTAAPLYLDITNFGYRKIPSLNDKHYFYRPEIGFGIYIFNVSYAYQIKLDHRVDLLPERHFFNFRVNFPFRKRYF